MVWIRPTSTNEELGGKRETIIEIPNRLLCEFSQQKQIICESLQNNKKIVIDINDLESNMWIHLALGGSESKDKSYLRIDYQDQLFKEETNGYLSLRLSSSNQQVYLGINEDRNRGFLGDIREFYFASKYIEPEQITNIQNQVLYWDLNQLAYYRLNNGNLFDSFRNQEASLYQQDSNNKANSEMDHLPNDICYPFFNTANLPKLNIGPNGDLGSYELDDRYERSKSNFQYTFSIWMKTDRSLDYASSTSEGRNSHYFFRLDNSFNLYSDSKNTIRIYFHALRNYNEMRSKQIFFPLEQWANLQVQIDRVDGYDARVYDLQRRQITRVSEDTYFYEQRPSGKFSLLNNFRGYSKSIMLWQSKRSLPITTPSGTSGQERNNDLLLYYKFDQTNWSQSQRLQSLARHSDQGLGNTIDFKSQVSFDVIEWEDNISYNSPSSLGTLYQDESLFDGIACKDQKLAYITKSQDSYVKYEIKELQNELHEATIEFWFKRDEFMIEQHYLLSLYEYQQEKEYFAVYQDEGRILTCAPFGKNNQDTQVKLSEVNYGQSGWQHISCRFTQNSQADALYNNEDGDDLIYSKKWQNQDMTIPSGNYTLIIGNNYELNQASTNTLFKDIRVWTSSLSNIQIYQNIQQQVDPDQNPTLLTYFRMSSGNYYIHNMPTLQQNSLAYKNEIDIVQDEDHTVCPLYTYQNQYNKDCYLNPFNEHMIHLLAMPQEDKTLVQWVLTTDYSDVVNVHAFDTMEFLWQTEHEPLQDMHIDERETQRFITLKHENLSNNHEYAFNVKVRNNKRTFASETEIKFGVQQCRWLGDIETEEAINHKLFDETEEDEDILFEFKPYDIDSSTCNDVNYFHPYLIETISWQVTPSFLDIQDITANYNAGSNSFEVRIPKEQKSKFPTDQFVNFIGIASWNQGQASLETIHLNVLYRIKKVLNIEVVLEESRSFKYIGETLKIDASKSYVTSIEDENVNKLGLGYVWECPDILQEFCDQQKDKSVLEIPYEEFDKANGEFKKHEFKGYVYRLQDIDASTKYFSTVEIEYLDVEIPSYDIVSEHTNLLVSRDNYVYLDLKNYPAGSPQLEIEWKIEPQPNNMQDNVQYQNRDSTMFIKKGALEANKEYEITVIAQNKEHAETLTTKSVKLKTGNPQSDVDILVSPQEGNFMDTNFDIRLQSWKSDYQPLQYRVKLPQSDSNYKEYELTSKLYKQSETFKTVLPQLSQIIVEIQDSHGELVSVEKQIIVSMDSNEAIQNSIQQLSDISNKLKKYNEAKLIAFQLNKQVQEDGITDQNLKFREQILDIIIKDTQNLQQGDTSTQTKELINLYAQVLNPLSEQSNFINSEMSTKFIEILTHLKLPSKSFEDQLEQNNFKTNYASSLSNLFQYATSNVNTQQSTGRNLESDEENFYLDIIKQVINIKQDMMDKLCNIIEANERVHSVKTDNFEFNIEKIKLDSNTIIRNYYYGGDDSQLVFPFEDIVEMTKKVYEEQTDHICIQTSFYSMNPLHGYTLQNKRSSANLVMQVQTLDYQQNRLIKDQQSIQLNQTLYQQVFPFNFDDPNFNEERTECMAVQIDEPLDFSDSQWETHSCETIFDKDQGIIICECDALGNNFYAVVSPVIIENDERVINEDQMKFKLQILVVLIPFGLFLILSCFIPMLDKRDYQNIERNVHDINVEFMKHYAFEKKMKIEQLVYQRFKIKEFQSIQTTGMGNLNFSTRIMLFSKYLHPLFNIFQKFDFEFKRLSRLVIIWLQLAFISIVIGYIFGYYYVPEDSDDTLVYNQDDISELDLKRAVTIGAIMSIFTLPLPSFIIKCLKSRLIYLDSTKLVQTDRGDKVAEDYEKEGGQEEQEYEMEGGEKGDFDDVNNISSSSTNKNEEHNKNKGKHQKVSQNEADLEQDDFIKLIDNCMCCKILFILISFLLAVFSVVFLAVVCSQISLALTSAIIISWFIAVFGGYFIINMIRIVMISILAPKIVENIQYNGNIGYGPKPRGCSLINKFFFVPQEAIDILQDIDTVQIALSKALHEEPYNTGHQKTDSPMANNGPNMKTFNSQNAKIPERYQEDQTDEELPARKKQKK